MTSSSRRHDQVDLEAFRKRLPYETIPTNVPGVLATAALPAGFDPHNATEQALVKHGLLWRRPASAGSEVLRRAWDRAFARPWLPENHVVPVLKTVVGPSRRRRPVVVAAERTSSNWTGGVVDGVWNTVSAFWVVPTVSKPTEKERAGNGWFSASWIGIDGDVDPSKTVFTDDVLQAGVAQNVDPGGKASYGVWFEWFTSFTRTTLDDTTPSSYALAPHTDGLTLLLAYRRGDDDRLSIMYSLDDGNSFGNKINTSEQTVHGPALTLHDGFVMMAWTAKSGSALHVATVTMAGTDLLLGTSASLPWTSKNGPALASLDRVLYVAWQDPQNRLNIASSTDGGLTFGGLFTSTVTSTVAPALTVDGGNLFIAWKQDATNQLGVARVKLEGGVATDLWAVVTIPTETSTQSPSIAATGGALYIAWKGDGDHLNVLQSDDGGQSFGKKYTSTERSPSGPTLAVFEEKLLIGWRGENDHVDLAGVGIRSGAVVGLNAPAPYRYQQNVQNFPVKPGDEVVCSVFYVQNWTAGYIAFGNVTTGQYFSVTMPAPLEADLTGGSIEWIMEAPAIGGVTDQSTMPRFTDVVFTDAFGCGPDGAVGDPGNGDTYILHDPSNFPLTSVAVAPRTVTIEFTG